MSRPVLLILDDDESFAAKLAGALDGLFRVEICHSEDGFRARFEVGRYDLLIMDMRLRDREEGLDLLREAMAKDPLQAAIVMTAYAETSTYADAIEAGALTYLDKREFSPALIARTVQAIVEQSLLRRRLAAAQQRLDASEPREMIGVSAGIKAAGEAIRRAAADGNAPVLLLGEPGSGRHLAARNIHGLSQRRADGPFVHAVCGRVRNGTAVAALFGAVQSRGQHRSRESKGWVDAAKGGVLFVDGLGGLDGRGISTLARLIETGRFTRAGGGEQIESDAQILVSATDVEALDPTRTAMTGRGGIEIGIPPLRHRREDISLIAQYTLQRVFRLGRTQARSFRGAALASLEVQPWPGNVRELISAIEYAGVRADATGAREIGLEHLPNLEVERIAIGTTSGATLDYQINLARAELGLVESAIERFETTTKSVLAQRLRYNDRFTFSRRLRKTLAAYPPLREEFPHTAALFPEVEAKRHRSAGNGAP